MNSGGLDGSGTIDPASLNPASAYTIATPFSPPTTATEFENDTKPNAAALASITSPRGIKRSRSPEPYRDGAIAGDDLGAGATEEPVRRKRGRPPKNKGPGVPQSPQLASTPQQQHQQLPAQTVSTPQQIQQLQTPTQQPGTLPTPPKPTPAKPMVKALPTVRDHTTDQLTPEGDEYIPREYDEEGDKKVMQTGHLCNGREYKCRTFHVPNRGEKLFMLATECARVLGYRDSYLLFNKNRSLFKIIATQAEKDDLIQQELLPYSYRSRQIAIVTARSMFRQFGSRVIVNGRRVRDDYWESKARKQGFTEEDPAGEKRPGAAKIRAAQASEQAAAQQQQQAAQQQQQQHGQGQEALYTHDPAQIDQQPVPQMVQPGLGGPAPTVTPLPMIHLAPTEEKLRELYSVPRPRQEVSGPPYQDRMTSTSQSQVMEHVHNAADFNKQLGQTSKARRGMYQENYFKPKSPPQPQPQPQQHNPSVLNPQQQQQQAQQQQAQQQQAQQAQQQQQQQPANPQLPHPSQHAPIPQHPQLHAPPPHMMSPQQLSSLHHQQQQQQQQQQQHQQLVSQSPVRSNQGIKPEQLHTHGGGPYMPPAQYFHPQAPHTPQPSHPHQHPGPHHPQPHPQSMPSMHTQHGQQQPPMYSSPTPQHYLGQPPPPQNYRQQGSAQGGWWNTGG
ncbi:uncharacterized protein H6S33_007330 [Morchella sextelata]|uniref:uncharacterized protein n=1 Tax=Morchella sextelata TaxID=1174677 RepID=UPI001D043496|nr:uncharacterized protein H6S33_007330 [Morchella sextelata]KAH0603671.1 hypothetical protein H6S33_007330 [Morchella sextelata]